MKTVENHKNEAQIITAQISYHQMFKIVLALDFSLKTTKRLLHCVGKVPIINLCQLVAELVESTVRYLPSADNSLKSAAAVNPIHRPLCNAFFT